MARETLLITGGAGFIGSHAAETFLDLGYHVIAVDNFCDFYDRSWKEMNLQTIRGGESIDVQVIEWDGAGFRGAGHACFTFDGDNWYPRPVLAEA